MTNRERLHEIVDGLPAWQVEALLTLLQEPAAPAAGEPAASEDERAYDELMPHLGL